MNKAVADADYFDLGFDPAADLGPAAWREAWREALEAEFRDWRAARAAEGEG